MPGRGRPFEKKNQANPRGRPRGVKETMPRGFVKKLTFGALEGGEQAVRTALERAATNPKTVAQVLALLLPPIVKRELARCAELRRAMIQAGWFN